MRSTVKQGIKQNFLSEEKDEAKISVDIFFVGVEQ